ncbi:hypothetical protein [Clostridium manihotivorum]|uniref:Uncharacterized protein n=1 Tax=Clostridium manihotivorum TaxID=2320868 RepID=A0A3R5X418_9CLOT|nr:hypothetical protein [Clostridium manihotivorum]QAA34030.1 hypothetical protein C1I91_21730 [Clostridium manihotivorum]
MKYGLDIENKDISSFVNDMLMKNGHATVNFTFDKNMKFGEMLFKKALLANQTRVDLYLNIKDEVKDVDVIDVYVSNEDELLTFLHIFKRKMEEIGFQEVCIRDGSELYLCKKVEAPTVIMNIKSHLIDISKGEFCKALSECLINISS